MGLICIKNITDYGISIIADELTMELKYLEHMYPVGSEISHDEDIKEMNDDIYILFKYY